MQLDLLVIGSGPGGQRAAIQAAKLGHSVAVCERRDRIGGVSIHTGTIPSKTLRQAVLEHIAQRPLDVHDPTRVDQTDEQALQALMDREARVVAVETAVGSVPARPKSVAFDDSTIIDSDGLLKMQRRVPRSMTVVGAGVIGVEYASMFGALGT